MTQFRFEKLNDFAQNVQKPFQQLIDLNVKTMQDFSFLKPEELANIKRPEELLEKQVNVAIQNGHKALDYMQKSFQIYENILLSLVKETKEAKEKSDTKK